MHMITQRFAEMDRLVYVAHRFAKICRNNPIKLFSLLYLLDIRHYREAGESCTGETYYAMADGPAPGTLRHLLVMRDLDIDSAIGILTSTRTKGPWPFDPHPYCKRALEIMSELETRHNKSNYRDLSLDDGHAWWRVYNRSVGAAIPYEMTLPSVATKITIPEKTMDRPLFPLMLQTHQALAPGLFLQFR